MNTHGMHVTITRVILQVFLEWFSFAKPLEEMLSEAMSIAREAAERYKQWEEQRESFKRAYSDYQYYYREYRPLHALPLSNISSALAVFHLDASVATKETIKKRYRALAKELHPDTLNGDEEAFKKLNNANEVLMEHFSKKGHTHGNHKTRGH